MPGIQVRPHLPRRLTQRQLRRWQRAEAMGAMARAVVVMAAGIHEMYWPGKHSV